MEMSVSNILKCGEYVDYISKKCVYTYIYTVPICMYICKYEMLQMTMKLSTASLFGGCTNDPKFPKKNA